MEGWHIESPGDVLAVEHADGAQMWTAAQEERRSAIRQERTATHVQLPQEKTSSC